MSDPTVTPIRRKVTPEVRDYSEIEHDLNQVKCTLICATVALGKAQDEADGEVAAQAWAVLNGCAFDLGRIERDLERWHMHHDHSPKECANG